MKEFRGVAASPGIAIGKAFLYSDDELTVPEYEIFEHDIVTEMTRYRQAVGSAVRELETIKNQSGPAGDPDGFIDTHILMLLDPEIEMKVDVKIAKVKKNVEWVLQDVVNELLTKLSTVQDIYLKERTMDIRDVSRRVLGHLMERKGRITLSELDEEIILVTSSLMPSDAVAMSKKFVKGLAMDAGGKTTHTAILARSFEIPAVLGTVRVSREVHTGDMVIVDGLEGKVIVDPPTDLLEVYRSRQKEYRAKEVRLQSLNVLASETRDGHRVVLNANIEIPEEIDAVLAHGADGIGLYRSEFLFIKYGVDVSEEIQFQAYSSVLKGARGKSVTIRTLDLGGDKLVPDLFPLKESNPLLGWRAIRFCLATVDTFRRQLRALLRASIFGNLKIMFPMISGAAELEEALQHVEAVKAELRKSGTAFNEDIPVGSMIEVPSAGMVSDHLAKMVDFFSIGTNDLIQYTLAVDRGNERITKLYEPFHPGVLRLIKTIIDNAHAAGIPVAMCGEMASDPSATAILLGLGLDEFSMNAVGIPKVKQIVRELSRAEAKTISDQVLTMRRSSEIEEFISAYIKGRFSQIDKN